MDVCWPWKNLGELGFKRRSGMYIGFFRNPYWGIFIFNPKRRYGALSCRFCKKRILCLSRERCYFPRTWIILRSLTVKVRS